MLERTNANYNLGLFGVVADDDLALETSALRGWNVAARDDVPRLPAGKTKGCNEEAANANWCRAFDSRQRQVIGGRMLSSFVAKTSCVPSYCWSAVAGSGQIGITGPWPTELGAPVVHRFG